MAGKAYLGIDAGTSVVKAAIFDQNGDALAVQGRSIPLMHDRGGLKGAVEQDFDVILATMSAVVSDAIREAGQAPESVALTGQGDGCWITDEKFHPVRPALSWLDGRAGGTGRRVVEVRCPAGRCTRSAAGRCSPARLPPA